THHRRDDRVARAFVIEVTSITIVIVVPQSPQMAWACKNHSPGPPPARRHPRRSRSIRYSSTYAECMTVTEHGVRLRGATYYRRNTM
ncbi:MAG TPA: hypothetical protein VMK12_23640, partial [Anaeromyxobacteraceae bacterium]|nr:hypothetical protein [Anaeromyxobacteraceae bacterium]